MDNFYNSPVLLRCLKRHKTDCFGTLRLNREFVPSSMKSLTKTLIRQGEVVATYCSDLAIIVWRDANIVSLISTYHNLQIGTQDKYNRIKHKPTIVLDYNKAMGGVDRKDQFLSAQPMERVRNRVWYKKLFRRLYNAAIFNCFVIYSSSHRNISHRKFRTALAEDLLRRHRQLDLTSDSRRFTGELTVMTDLMTDDPTVTTATRGRQTATRGRRRQTATTGRRPPRTQARPHVESNHFPMPTGSYYTVCTVCRRRTSMKCEECNVNMCMYPCFKTYHKNPV